MARAIRDLSNKIFGKLLALEPIKKIDKNNKKIIYWKCKCLCGKFVEVRMVNLINGSTNSCGCFRKEKISKLHSIHKMSNSRIYSIYAGMFDRCYNENNKDFINYGDRGIKICDEWLKNRMLFFKWSIEHGYNDNLTIDRINNNEGYSPNNCRWATSTQQANNRRSNVFININGYIKTIKQWSIIYKIDSSVIWHRINSGWEKDKAVLMPVRKIKKKG